MGQKTELVWLAGHLWPSSRSLGTSYLFQRPEILQRSFGTVFKCGKLLLCVFLGTVVRGADTPPPMKWSLAPLPGDSCAQPWQGVAFRPPWCEILGLVLCHFGSR